MMIDLLIVAVSATGFFICLKKENKTVVFILWILMVLSLVKIAENIDKEIKNTIISFYSFDEPGQFDPRIPIIRIYLDYENPQDTLLKDSILIYERELSSKNLINE
jgi:uncharacterized membrane protein